MIEERAAGEQDDEQDRDQEARQRIADDDHGRGPGVEPLAVVDRLADAERDRDQVGDERHPDAERHRDRQLLLDQVDHPRVAEIALAEVERRIVPEHQQEALVRRLVEAELLLQALDEFGVEALGAAILGAGGVELRSALRLTAPAQVTAGRARDARGRAGVRARQLGDDALDRSARRELHHHKGNQEDSEQGRNHQKKAADDIGGHRVSSKTCCRSRRRSLHPPPVRSMTAG